MSNNIYILCITLCGNSALGQEPSQPPHGLKRMNVLTADSMDSLSEQMKKFQLENDIGEKSWKKATLYCDITRIGLMSYNGLVTLLQWTNVYRKPYKFKQPKKLK